MLQKHHLKHLHIFPHGRPFTTYQAIYVPSTYDKTKHLPMKKFGKRITETQRFLSKQFGGSTRIKTEGTYVLHSGKLIKEPIAKVESFSTGENWKRRMGTVEKFLKGKAGQWGQESIGYEFESPKKHHGLYFISKRMK